eukprot:767970-Hanusia_phi.AAC.4
MTTEERSDSRRRAVTPRCRGGPLDWSEANFAATRTLLPPEHSVPDTGQAGQRFKARPGSVPTSVVDSTGTGRVPAAEFDHYQAGYFKRPVTLNFQGTARPPGSLRMQGCPWIADQCSDRIIIVVWHGDGTVGAAGNYSVSGRQVQ